MPAGAGPGTFAHRPALEAFRALVDRTPELRDFGRRAWTQHAALADTITDDATRRGQPVDPVQAGVLARFVLESLDLASVSPDPATPSRPPSPCCAKAGPPPDG